VVVVLGFDERNWQVGFVKQEVVGALFLAACHHLPADDDPAVGERELASPLMIIPTSLGEGRADEPVADVRFAQLFLIHSTPAPHPGSHIILRFGRDLLCAVAITVHYQLQPAICQQLFVSNLKQQTSVSKPLYNDENVQRKSRPDGSGKHVWVYLDRFYRYMNSCKVVGFVGFAGAEGAGWFAAFCG